MKCFTLRLMNHDYSREEVSIALNLSLITELEIFQSFMITLPLKYCTIKNHVKDL